MNNKKFNNKNKWKYKPRPFGNRIEFPQELINQIKNSEKEKTR